MAWWARGERTTSDLGTALGSCVVLEVADQVTIATVRDSDGLRARGMTAAVVERLLRGKGFREGAPPTVSSDEELQDEAGDASLSANEPEVDGSELPAASTEVASDPEPTTSDAVDNPVDESVLNQSIPKIEAALATGDYDHLLTDLRLAEEEGKDRVGAKEAISARLEFVAARDGGSAAVGSEG